MEDKEDAATLQFSDFWATASSMNISEVESVLKGPYQRMANEGKISHHLQRAYLHALKFSRIRDVQQLQQLRVNLEDWEAPSAMGALQDNAKQTRLDAFEISQIVNLMPTDADEAKALMPSLCRFQNSDVMAILEILGSYSKIQLGGNNAIALPAEF
jgi:DNA-directed RNA polymerase subunit F